MAGAAGKRSASDVLEVFARFEARFLGFTWNTPKPRSSIRSPRCMEIRIASNTASTATSALTLVMSAMRDTSLTMSTLIMLTGSSGSVNSVYIFTYAVKRRSN